MTLLMVGGPTESAMRTMSQEQLGAGCAGGMEADVFAARSPPRHHTHFVRTKKIRKWHNNDFVVGMGKGTISYPISYILVPRMFF